MNNGFDINEIVPGPKTVPLPVKFFELLGQIGLGSPVARTIIGFLLGSGLTWMFQPAASFDELGPRPLKVLTNQPDRGTWFPWYLPGVILAFVFGVVF